MPVKTIKTVVTPFKNKIFYKSDNTAKLNIFNYNDSVFILVVTSEMADLFYDIECQIYKLNPNLILKTFELGPRKDKLICYSTKTDYFQNDNWEKSFWLFFQVNQIKIQISLNFRHNSIVEFYNANKNLFSKYFVISESDFKTIMEVRRDNRNDTLGKNRVFIYKGNGEIINWINLQVVNSEPLDFLFHYVKTIGLISPRPNDINYCYNKVN